MRATPLAETVAGGFKSDIYGFWAKTLGNGVMDHIIETKDRLQNELEQTRQTMLDLAEAQMHEMIAKIESGEMHLEDNSLEPKSASNKTTTGMEGTQPEHRELANLVQSSLLVPQFSYDGALQDYGDVFRGQLAPLFTTKPDFRRCTFFGGSEICLPAKRYFVR